MSHIIISNSKAFNFYSTISDMPIFESALTKEQVKEYIKEENGSKGLRELKERLKRVNKKGTSSLIFSTLEETISVYLENQNITIKEFKSKYLSFQEIEKDSDPIGTSDFWYDLFEGGYIKPEELIENKEKIEEINEAIEVLKSFKTAVLVNGLVEEI